VTLLVATGLRREARRIASAGVVAIAGGGDAARLEAQIEALAGSAVAILSSGLAGALSPLLVAGDIVIGTGLVDQPPIASRLADWLVRKLPDARVGLIAANDRPVADAAAKAALHARTGALAVDMESHVAARVAARHKLPFAALRVISDRAGDSLPPAALVGMRADGAIAVGAVIGSLLRHPLQLPALLRTAREAEAAFRALGRVHDVLRSAGIGRLDPRELAFDMA
jgi:hopanoid-associated phosphorylase